MSTEYPTGPSCRPSFTVGTPRYRPTTRRLIRVGLAGAIAAATFAAPLARAALPVHASLVGSVTTDQALTAVRTFLADLPQEGGMADLRGTRPLTPTLDAGVGSESAYYVPLARAGSVVGYAIVGAAFDQAPILKLSHGDLMARLPGEQAAAAASTGHRVISSVLQHVDQLTEVATFTLDDGGTVSADLATGQIGAFSGGQRPDTTSATSNADAWKSLLGVSALPGVTVVHADPATLNELTPRPNYQWTYGCAPTAGTMVEAYWSQHGYASLMPITDFPSTSPPEIGQMAQTMGTDSSGGTFLTEISAGMGTYEQNHGVDSGVVLIPRSYGNVPWSVVASYIGRGLPSAFSAIGWDFYAPGATSYDGYHNMGQRIDHTVAVFGTYVDVLNNNYMVIHDDAVSDGDVIISYNYAWSESQLDTPGA